MYSSIIPINRKLNLVASYLHFDSRCNSRYIVVPIDRLVSSDSTSNKTGCIDNRRGVALYVPAINGPVIRVEVQLLPPELFR